MNNYKYFIIFLILAISNLYDYDEDIEINEIINNIKNKVKLVISYYIYYIYDNYKSNNGIIENYLIYIFKLMIKIINIIYNQNKKKSFSFYNFNKQVKRRQNYL